MLMYFEKLLELGVKTILLSDKMFLLDIRYFALPVKGLVEKDLRLLIWV